MALLELDGNPSSLFLSNSHREMAAILYGAIPGRWNLQTCSQKDTLRTICWNRAETLTKEVVEVSGFLEV
jgi:hypothetical protein